MADLSVSNIMALRQSILQRNDALKDAASSTAGQAGGAAGAGAGGGAQGLGGVDFAQAIKGAINEVSALQAKSTEVTTAFERGETTDIASVMLARQQASVGFETTLQVRNKLLSAYRDIMSMPV